MSDNFKKGITKVIDTYEKWWGGELDRGLIPVTVISDTTGQPKPKGWDDGFMGCSQALFANTDITPEEFIDCVDYGLSKMEFLGDAFPRLCMDVSGAGIVAAFLGASVRVLEGYIWFHPNEYADIRDLHFEYNPNNPWLVRTKEIIKAGKKRWGDKVLIGQPDYGGASDILATFRKNENLLLDLYDHPDEVRRLMGEIHDLWHVYYNELAPLCNDGFAYTDWSAIISKKPSYMFQSDFC